MSSAHSQNPHNFPVPPAVPVSRDLSNTPYDNSVFARLRKTLDARGFYTDSPPPKPHVDMEVKIPSWSQPTKRATRYLEVVAVAGSLVLGETGAGLGTAEGYRRSSFSRTQVPYSTRRQAPDPHGFASNGTHKQMFWISEDVVAGPNEHAPKTRRERKAVERIRKARVDAAISAGRERVLADEGSTAYAALVVAYHRARFERKMRKAGRVADGTDLYGRYMRHVASRPNN